MGTRYQRFLRRVTGDRQPTSVCCLTVTGRRGPDPDAPSRRREELQSWSLVRWRTEAGRPVRERHIAGQTAAQFWSEVGGALSCGAPTWLISPSAVRDMTLLGLWERIETGEVHFTGDDYRDGDNGYANEVPPVLRDGGQADPGGRGGAVGAVPGVRPAPGSIRAGGVSPGQQGRKRQVGYCVLEDPPTVALVRVRGKPGLLRWLDTRNYGLGALQPLRPPERGPEGIVRAVRGVCDALHANGLGALQHTAGSQAWYSFKRKHMGTSILIHNHKRALDLERAAYVGGRCECFRIGALPPPVYHLDYRSLYGWVMREHSLPVRLRGYWHPESSRDGCEVGPQYGVIAEVLVETDEPAYPAVRPVSPSGAPVALAPGEPLPTHRTGCAVYYPVGRFRCALAGPELEDAISLGRVRRYDKYACYDCEPALAGYARDLLRLRELAEDEGRADLAAVWKSLLVCLPGKLGQVGRAWVDAPQTPADGPYSTWYAPGPDGDPVRHRSLAWHTQREEITSETEESCPAMAAWITSAGRMRLLEAIRAAGWAETYYCDTDAVMVSQAGAGLLDVCGLTAARSAGKLRLLGEHRSAALHGIKHYTLDGRTVQAGVPLPGRGDDPGEPGPWVHERLHRAAGERRRPVVRLRKSDVARAGAYTHGSVGASGLVEPWRLWED